MPTSDLSFIVHVDDCDSPADMLEAAALAPFVAGAHRWSQMRHLDRVREDAPLLPPGVEPERVAVEGWRTVALARGDGWQLCVRRQPSERTADLTITATSSELAQCVLDAATVDAVEPDVDDDSSVNVGFWHLGAHGPARTERTVGVRPWVEIRTNYARRSGAALDDVMAMAAPGRPGRLLLLHGPPGTGKTTALRALAHAWRSWAQMDYVLDPEKLFADPGYLMAVALGGEDEEFRSGGRWRLLVLEDCDELIGANAKSGAGQGLARLLNLTDGLLGQGLSVLVCLTTNEPLSRLHPAVVRPGRCLAEIEVASLSRVEAEAWLGASVPAEGATLAELLARRGDLASPARASSSCDDSRPMQYL